MKIVIALALVGILFALLHANVKDRDFKLWAGTVATVCGGLALLGITVQVLYTIWIWF